jgi:hypothetical protein
LKHVFHFSWAFVTFSYRVYCVNYIFFAPGDRYFGKATCVKKISLDYNFWSQKWTLKIFSLISVIY